MWSSLPAARVFFRVFQKFPNTLVHIEIINNTRGGIGTGNINSKRERTNGGQIQVPDALEVRYTELYIRMDSAVFIVQNIRDLNLPPISALSNFALNASCSVIYKLYARARIAQSCAENHLVFLYFASVQKLNS